MGCKTLHPSFCFPLLLFLKFLFHRAWSGFYEWNELKGIEVLRLQACWRFLFLLSSLAKEMQLTGRAHVSGACLV